MKKKVVQYVLLTFLIASILLNIYLILVNTKLLDNIPFLRTGENINCFNLLDMSGKKVNSDALNEEGKKMVFIFARPCSICNRNIVFWNKISEIVGDKTACYGIIIDSFAGAYNFYNDYKNQLKFDVYVPESIGRFIKKNRIMLNMPQTILYDTKILYSKIGDLNGNETTKLINSINKNE
ncbi:MAG: hypothetical protein MUP71_05270 [Candidatus Aminicenantes bacterium]|nr:hypothetical protein [Candidatus Aminicenantes bacterium]